MLVVLGSDAACLAATGTTAPLTARPPSRDESLCSESLCSLLPQHTMRRLRLVEAVDSLLQPPPHTTDKGVKHVTFENKTRSTAVLCAHTHDRITHLSRTGDGEQQRAHRPQAEQQDLDR
eukprot:scaffold68886_cov57-Phaeocystis_antarctica.AAC.1